MERLPKTLKSKKVSGPDSSSYFIPESFGTDKKTGGKTNQKKSYVLVLDHDAEEGEDIRPRLPQDGLTTMLVA